MPVLALSFTITAEDQNKGKHFCWMLWWATVWFKRIFFFFQKDKTTLSNKPFLWCFMIKVSIRHRLCCEHTQHLGSCWVLNCQSVSYTAVWARGDPAHSPPPASHAGSACLLLGVAIQALLGDFPLHLLQFHCLHLEQTHLSQISCAGLTLGGPYLVTLDSHNLLTLKEGCVSWREWTRTPTPASKRHVHEAMSQVASLYLQSLCQCLWTNVVWMYTVVVKGLLRIPEPWS